MMLPSIILFVIGTIFGSFLSVIISRIRNNKKGIFFGKSECPKCEKKLNSRDLIPIISYLINKRRCRHCKEKISIHYPMLELFAGLLFVAFYLKFPFVEIGMPLFQYIYFTIIGLFLIGIFFYDILYMEIPEIFTYPAIVIIFISAIIFPEPGISSMVIGGAAGGLFYGLQVWISKEKWMGTGDTQIGVLTGLLLGWQLFILCLIITYIVGSIVSIPFLISKKLSRKSKIPFAPFMVTAIFITIFFGEYLYDFYFQTLV